MQKAACSLFLAAALAGCAAGPDYVRPAVDVPPAWQSAGQWRPAHPLDAAPRGDWWHRFGDPQLDRLMTRLDQSNQTLLQAAAQYRQARALADEAHAAFLPNVTAGLAFSRGRANQSVADSHTLTLDAGWEPDLWGRVRRQTEAAAANAQASAADLAAARLATQAELAQDYFQLRVLDAESGLDVQSARADAQILAIARNRYRAGIDTRAAVAQAQAQLSTLRMQTTDRALQRRQLAHAIAVLTGQPPSALQLPPAPLRVRLPAIPPGVPSALLQRRPDIAAAERRVAAANADIGVARAALYPALTLTASGGFAGSGSWLLAPARVWGLGAALAQTVFAGGAQQAGIAAARAAYDAAAAQYRQTVLSGFQEVEDNLAAQASLARERADARAAADAAREAERITLAQYHAGATDYLTVASAQLASQAAARAVLAIEGRQLTACALLIKALGGGWQVPVGSPGSAAGRQAASAGRQWVPA